MIINMVSALSEASNSKQISCHKLMIHYPSSYTERRPTWFIITAWPVSAQIIITLVHRSNWDNHGPMTELVPLAKELGIKRVIIKMLQLSQVNLLFVPCPFKSIKQNIHSATMSGPQHKMLIYNL